MAARIAGPTKRPISPQAVTPPRMPRRTQTNGSRVDPPISTGRKKWSATKVTTAPSPTTTTAPTTLPTASSTTAARPKATAAPNGTMARSAVTSPNRVACGAPTAK